MIICENLYKVFDKNNGIFDINLKLEPGKIIGIVGYNGAGKTTLLRCIEGLYLPTSGNVYHNSISTKEEKKIVSIRRNISFLPSEDYLYPKLTCKENIELATILKTGKSKFEEKTNEIIEYLDVEKYLNKEFRFCSTGMKKKIQIITSLIGDINTIIWDEPNDGLDLISNIKIKNLLKYFRNKNYTVIFSSHVVEFLENFIDEYIIIQDGKLVDKGAITDKISLEKILLEHIDIKKLSAPFI